MKAVETATAKYQAELAAKGWPADVSTGTAAGQLQPDPREGLRTLACYVIAPRAEGPNRPHRAAPDGG